MRRHYEVMMILDPRLEEPAIQDAVGRLLGVLGDRGGEVLKVNHWGRRKFAYEMRHLREGYYVVADFEADSGAVKELDRVLKLADEVVRHKIVRPGKD